MRRLEPFPGMTLQVSNALLAFMPDPLFPEDNEVVARQGAESVLYQLVDTVTEELWALKVFHPGFNTPRILEVTERLSSYAHLPGLSCASRCCLTRATAPATVQMYPALERSVLMPWVVGRSWAGLMLSRASAEHYTPRVALNLACALALCLSQLEEQGLAHSDVAGSNILINDSWDRIELVDIERTYLAHGPRPVAVSFGSPGYAHPHLDANGQWCPEGDRFAGGIALVEMLAWSDPMVRAHTPLEADTLFDENDLQNTRCKRWELARDAVWALCSPALDLFDQLWSANDLTECPPLHEWARALYASQVNADS